MLFGFLDPTYLVLIVLIPLVISGAAQMYLRSTYGKWKATPNTSHLAGPQVAQQIMRTSELANVQLEMSQGGGLSDHFDPRSNTVRMSPEVAQQPSVASMAIVAHELGHAQQYAQGSALISIRSFLLPAVQISPTISYGLILFGLLLNFTGLAWLGVIVFGISVVFMLLTLPVEFDASRRGLNLLEQSGLFQSENDRKGSQQVLRAAALTYVAAAVTSILTLLYYVSLVSRRSNR